MRKLLALILILTASQAWADGAAPKPRLKTKKRPKLALVLSGGGPRGGAQIGVLKVLRDLHIPVDFVVGCSIGSYVGGFYAAGMTPEEIEKTMREMNFREIFSDSPPRTELPFRLKQKDFNYLTGLNLGIGDGGLRTRRGMSSGRHARYALKRYLAAYQDLDNFDNLPVPFRAAASDLTHGRAAYLKEGDLSAAIMASMSFPGLIIPRRISGTTYVDGWVTRNLPIDAARDFGAEALVVVDIGTQFKEKRDFGSLLEVTFRLLDMVTEEATHGQRSLLTDKDVKITPEMESFGGLDYDRLDEALKIGEDAARAASKSLMRYSVSAEDYEAWDKQRRKYAAPRIELKDVRISGAPLLHDFVQARLRAKAGQTLDFKELERDLEGLMDTGLFEDVDYELKPLKAGGYALVVEPIEKNWGPNYLNVGLKLVSDFEGRSDFEIGIDYTQTRLSDSGLEWRHQVFLGRVNLYDSELYQPIFSSPFFVAPGLEVASRVENLDNGNGTSSPASTSWADGRADLGLRLGNDAELRAGWKAGELWAGALGGINAQIPIGGPHLALNIDTLDEPHFPSKGSYLRASYDEARANLSGDPAYRVLRGTADEAFSVGANTVVLGFDGSSSLGSSLPFFEVPSLGGFLRLSGYHDGQLRGNEALLGRLVYYHQTRQPLAIFGDRICLGFSLEAGNTWASSADAQLSGLKSSASLLFGLNTALGPVYFAHGRNAEGGGVTYFCLGNPF